MVVISLNINDLGEFNREGWIYLFSLSCWFLMGSVVFCGFGCDKLEVARKSDVLESGTCVVYSFEKFFKSYSQ